MVPNPPGLRQFAGQHPEIQAIGLANLLASGVVGGAQVVDWVTGPTHALNSGEIPLNMLIGLIPMSAGLAGMGLATVASPAAKLEVQEMALSPQAQAYRAELDALKEAINAKKAGGASTAELVDAIRQGHERMNAKYGNVSQEAKDMINQRKNLASRLQEMKPDLHGKEAYELVRRRGARALGLGALAGTVAGAVPALQMMRDRPNE